MHKEKKNVPMQFLLRFLEGILIGTGGILPGVSGGALCVVFGIYRPLMELFSNPFKNLKKYFWMLFPYGLGIGVGFIGLAGLVDYVLRTHEALAVCAFVGLILGMVPQLFRDAGEQGRGKGDWVALSISFALLTALFLYLRYGAGMHIVPNVGWWLVCGAIWGLNVILPGMSSSSMLIFLGLYQPMLAGISRFSMQVILPIGAGAVLVILTLSKAVNALFSKHYARMYHVILGAVLATVVPLIPIHFSGVWDVVLDALCIAGGFVVSLLLNKVSQKYLHKAETQDGASENT
ncbi:MAG: DUF368 domain-containing protein [Acutalibacteraceae bacterium]